MNLSTVPNCLLTSPDGTLSWVVEVQDAVGPVAGATVTISLSTGATDMMSWPIVGGPPFTATTGPNGIATFNMVGGGVIHPLNFPPQQPCADQPQGYVVQVSVTGPFGSFDKTLDCISSPDNVGPGGNPPSCPNHNTCNNGLMEVGLSDAVFCTPAIARGLVFPPCNFTGPDYNDPVGLADAVIFARFAASGTTAPCR